MPQNQLGLNNAACGITVTECEEFKKLQPEDFTKNIKHWERTRMSKAADMAKISVKGGFHVMWGLIVSTVISAVGTILIALLLGEENYGLYTIALTAPTLIVLFRDWGVTSAMVRYTAQSNAENKTANIRSIFMSGLIFEIALGIALSMLGFLLSAFLATTVFNRPLIAPLLQIASFTILTSALVSTATAAFTGIEKMHLNSIMQVSQSIIKTALIIALVLVGLGTYGAITGFTVATLLAGLIGIMLMFTIYKRLPKPNGSKVEVGNNIKTMLKYGLPLSLSAIIAGFLAQYYNFLLYICVSDNALIGNYAIAQNFVVLITFFAAPITTMLFPAFSKIDHQKDPETLKNVFQTSVKYASLLVVPVAAMIMALAQPAISTLFGNKYAEAPLFLALLAITYLYPILGSLSIGSLINGQGQTTFNLIIAIITAAVGFPLGFILISNYGVLGLIVTALTASIPGIITSLLFIKKRYNVTVHWQSSAKILFSSAAAATLTYVLLIQFHTFSSITRLIIGVAVFTPTYLTAAILTKTFNKADIGNLREMFTALGPLQRLFNTVLNLIEKLMTAFTQNKKQQKATKSYQLHKQKPKQNNSNQQRS
jgi:O-antigen/teichoic acid export membrane protein